VRRSFLTLVVAVSFCAELSGCSAAASGSATGNGPVLAPGHGTATVTWRSPGGGSSSPGNPPQPFTGTIGGHQLTGVATNPLTSSSSAKLVNPSKSSGEIEILKYVGKLAGHTYNVGLYVNTPLNLSSGSFEAKGTYDGLPVSAVLVGTTKGSFKAGSVQGTFHGTIGKLKVSGTISAPTGNTNRQMAKAVYTVTR
jgi:hypothetical protein